MFTTIKVTKFLNNTGERTQSADFLAKAFTVTGSCQKEPFGRFLVIVTFGIVVPSASLLYGKKNYL
jgi:hypothetical protein